MIRLGVLISGNGSNLQAIIDAIEEGALDASIELVVSSRPDAYGLKRAEAAGIPRLALTRGDYNDPLAADEHIAQALLRAGAGGINSGGGGSAGGDNAGGGGGTGIDSGKGVDYVVMAGYMRKVHEPLLTAFPNRVINIHPALLPSFVGAHAIEDAFAYGVKVTGVTVHLANEDYDKGPIVAQRAVAVEEDDSLGSLEQKIHEVEHALYPTVLQLFAEGRVAIREDGTTHIRSAPARIR